MTRDADVYADDFYKIPDALSQNEELRKAVIALVETQPIAAKVMEGGDRLEKFRAIMRDLFNDHDTSKAIRRTEAELPRDSSPHSHSNRVFAKDWAERHVLTQYSRFYNQAVMEKLIADGHKECHVPHSSTEDASSLCTQQLAGGNHDLQTLYFRLLQSYERGNWVTEAKIPNHPHCTHVVAPPTQGEDTSNVTSSGRGLTEEEQTIDSIEPLTILIDPGTASREEIADVLSDLSLLYRKMGGSGINFSLEGIHVVEEELS